MRLQLISAYFLRQVMLWQCPDALALTERQIAQVERTIGQVVRRDSFREVYGILTSFPGVALVTAATVIAEVGDFKRFPDTKAIGRYAGLNPRVFASWQAADGTHRQDRTERPAVGAAAGGLDRHAMLRFPCGTANSVRADVAI